MKPLIPAALLLWLSPLAAALPNDPFDGGRGQAPQLGAPPATPSNAKAVASNAAAEDQAYWVTVYTQDRNAAARTGMSIDAVFGERVLGVASANDLARLKASGLKHAATPLSLITALDFPAQDSSFHNYERLLADLRALAAGNPDLVSLYPIGQSLGGKDLMAVRLNTGVSGDGPSDKPGIIFLGTHHAREHLSTEVPLLLAKHLVENRAKPDIAKLLASRDIFIIPMVNPDGVEYDIRGGKYRMHRKNTRPNEDGSIGVDLNRNYGFHWAEGGASDDPRSETYHGKTAFSEPESQAVKRLVEKHKNNVKILLSYHTFSELILYPWGHSHDPIPEAKPLAAYKAMAQTMASMTGYTPQQSSDLYIASGDTTDWAWGVHKIFSFTFELTPKSQWAGGFYPGAKAIATTFQANIRPALYLIDLADNPMRAAGGTPGLSMNDVPTPGGK